MMKLKPLTTSCSLRLGTRGSRLARWQAEWVAGELRQRGHAVELVEIATHGDKDRGRPIEEIGTRGVFTKAIQQALVAGDVDLAVHSLKDLPTEPVPGLVLAAVPKRESPADVLVLGRDARSEGGAGKVSSTSEGQAEDALGGLSRGARVGTGSVRRQAQLRHWRPDLRLSEVRGNVETRLQKLDAGQFESLVLAEAGLRRLGLAERITRVLPLEVMLPAVGQGALGIECRAKDDTTLAAVAALNDRDTLAAVLAERELLSRLEGGCMAPIGAFGEVAGGELLLRAVVTSSDGTGRLVASDRSPVSGAAELGGRVADALLAQGARGLVATSRNP